MKTILIACVSLTWSEPMVAQTEVPLSQEALKIVARLKHSIEGELETHPTIHGRFQTEQVRRKLAAARRRFDDALLQLATLVPADRLSELRRIERRSIAAKLALIASEFSRNRQRFTEVEELYFTPIPTPRRVIHFREEPLRDVHATEEYRLVWEYLLLCARRDNPQYWRNTAEEALRRIGNDATLASYVYVVYCCCLNPKHENPLHEQRSTLQEIMLFPQTPSYARSVLDVVHLANEYRTTNRFLEEFNEERRAWLAKHDDPARDWVRRRMETTPAVIPPLVKYKLRDDLSEEDRAVLDVLFSRQPDSE